MIKKFTEFYVWYPEFNNNVTPRFGWDINKNYFIKLFAV